MYDQLFLHSKHNKCKISCDYCLSKRLFFAFHQVAAVETVAEVKAVGSVDSAPPAPAESTAKPPPFKDPTFMVRVCVHLSLNLSSVCSTLTVLSLFVFPF